MRDNKFITLLIIIMIGLVLLLGGIFIYLSPLFFEGKQEEEVTCEAVNGTTHIYRGQCLPDGFVPEDLVPLSPRANWLNTRQRLTLKAKVMVEQLIENAENDGMCLVVTSGYRSYGEQTDLYENTPEDKKDYVAEAGASEHQTGLAVDFAACPMSEGKRDDSVEREELAKDFEELPEYDWLIFNASKYGFERSFRTDNIDITGYAPESWHWMFIE